MLIVEEGRGQGSYEELRTIRVWARVLKRASQSVCLSMSVHRGR